MKNVFPKVNKLLLKESLLCTLFAFLVLGIISIVGLNFGFFKPFNRAFKDFSYLDLYYAEKLDENSGNINQNIVLVNINRLERREIAAILDKVAVQKPAVIGLDVIFKEKRDSLGDMAIANSHTIENLVATYAITSLGLVNSTKAISKPNQLIAYSNFSFDSETSVVRNFQGFRKHGDSMQISFASAISKAFLKEKWNSKLENYLQKERPINYKGNRGNFLVLENEDIINQERIPILKDKIVLLGYLGDFLNHSFDMEDKHFTPMNSKFVGKSNPDMFGLLIHANIINMIITNDFIHVVPNWILILITILGTYSALTYFIWLAKRGLVSYSLRLNLIRLLIMVFLIWISLILFRNGILFKTAGIIGVSFFSVSLLGYYKKVTHLLSKKFKWKSYLY